MHTKNQITETSHICIFQFTFPQLLNPSKKCGRRLRYFRKSRMVNGIIVLNEKGEKFRIQLLRDLNTWKAHNTCYHLTVQSTLDLSELEYKDLCELSKQFESNQVHPWTAYFGRSIRLEHVVALPKLCNRRTYLCIGI